MIPDFAAALDVDLFTDLSPALSPERTIELIKIQVIVHLPGTIDPPSIQTTTRSDNLRSDRSLSQLEVELATTVAPLDSRIQIDPRIQRTGHRIDPDPDRVLRDPRREASLVRRPKRSRLHQHALAQELSKRDKCLVSEAKLSLSPCARAHPWPSTSMRTSFDARGLMIS